VRGCRATHTRQGDVTGATRTPAAERRDRKAIPTAAACARPRAVSCDSLCPCSTPAAFACVSPCRTSKRVVLVVAAATPPAEEAEPASAAAPDSAARPHAARPPPRAGPRSPPPCPP